MPVTVFTYYDPPCPVHCEEAKSFRVDEKGYLLLCKGKTGGHYAIFAPHAWASAQES